MNQLKYLLLIPVLMSMLFFSSCSENLTSENQEKMELVTSYSILGDGELKETKGTKETYLDFYLGSKIPKWKEISFNDLTTSEKNEFENLSLKFQEIDNKHIRTTFFRGENGRNIIGYLINVKNLENKSEEVSFMTIDKVPTFPGCEQGDKKCFSQKVQKHFSRNFDTNLPKTLGLEPGKKRIFIGFKIDKKGDVVDVKARAPHEKIKQEVLSVMSSLPKMMPGEHKGKAVSVKYSIPFTIIVE